MRNSVKSPDMSTEGTFIVPPAFGKVGDYFDLPSYGIGSTVSLEWTFPYKNQDAEIWLLKDGDSLFCAELYLAKTSCDKLLGK